MLPKTILKVNCSFNISTPRTKLTIGSRVLKIAALEDPITLTPCKNAISATTVEIKANNNIAIKL